MLLFEFLQYDEEKYPELYRKSNEYIKGNNDGIAQPYLIGNLLLLLSYLKRVVLNDGLSLLLTRTKFKTFKRKLIISFLSQLSDFTYLVILRCK